MEKIYNILLVSSKEAVYVSLENILKTNLFTIIINKTTETVHKTLQDSEIHLLLIDIDEFPLNTISTFQNIIQSNISTKKIPIIVFTENFTHKTIIKSFEVGVTDCFQFPFSAAELVAQITMHTVIYSQILQLEQQTGISLLSPEPYIFGKIKRLKDTTVALSNALKRANNTLQTVSNKFQTKCNELKWSETALQSFFQSSSQIFIMLTSELHIISQNIPIQINTELFFKKIPQNGDNFSEYILEELKKEFCNLCNLAFTGKKISIEKNFLKNETDFNFEIAFIPFYADDCTVNYIVIRIEDTTELAKTKKLNQLFSATVLQSPAIIVITNSEAITEYVNPRYEEVTGYTASEVVGKNQRMMQSGKTNKQQYADLWSTISRNLTWNGELLNRKKNGQLYWEQASITPITTDKNEKKYLKHSFDITQRKAREEELQNRQHILMEQLKTVPIPSFTWQKIDNDFMLVEYNQAAYKLTNGFVEKLIGVKASAFYADNQQIFNDLDNCYEYKEKIAYEMNYFYSSLQKSSILFVSYNFIAPDFVQVLTEDISTKRKAELSLLESEERFRCAFYSSPIGMCLTTLLGQFYKVNNAFCAITGFENNNIENIFFNDFLYEEESKNDILLFNQLLNSEINYFQKETKLKHSNGKVIWVQMSVSLVLSADNKPLYFFYQIQNITDRKNSEQELRQLEQMIQNSLNEIYVFDEKTLLFQYVNNGAINNIGYSFEELKTLTPIHLKPFLTEQEFRNILTPLFLNQQKIISFEAIHQRKNKSLYAAEIKVEKMSWNGKDAFFAVINDISERKKAETALKESEEKFRQLAENIEYLLWLRKGTTVLYVSAAYETIFGTPVLEMYNNHNIINQYIVDEAKEDIVEKKRVCESTGSNFDAKYLIKRHDGALRWIWERTFHFADQEGELRFVGIIQDITKERNSEEQLKKAIETAQSANKMKSEFLANMSHEIRTPLNAIIGFSEILSETLGNSKTYESYIDGIVKSGRNLLAIINDILDLSKIEAGKLDLVNNFFDVRLLISDLEKLFEVNRAKSNLYFQIVIDPNLPRNLKLDETRLRQVLFNLIGNAFKFTPKGGIRLYVIAANIDTDKATVDVEFHVSDTGIGVPKDQQAAIFEPFIQQEGQSSRKYGGTGLGLPISKRLVTMMGGNLTLKSEPQKGSVFIVKLYNVAFSDDNYRAQIINIEEQFNFKKAKLLVVDDFASNRIIVKGYLKKSGIEIMEAANGEDAVRIAKQFLPDIILMDINMPIMNGLEATLHIKRIAELKNTPVIALTALAMVEQQNEITKICDGYLRKPILKDDLISELAKYLNITISQKQETKANVPVNKAEMFFDYLLHVGDRKKELREKFSFHLKEIFNILSNEISVDEVIVFAQELRAIGIEYNIEPLKQLAEQYHRAAASFDFDTIFSLNNEMNELFNIEF